MALTNHFGTLTLAATEPAEALLFDSAEDRRHGDFQKHTPPPHRVQFFGTHFPGDRVGESGWGHLTEAIASPGMIQQAGIIHLMRSFHRE